MLYDSVGGFWWIDHTRTFSRLSRLPLPDRIKRCSRSLLAAIRNLEIDAVRDRLSPYLNGHEIKSLFARRDKLVALLEEKIAAQGEDRFLFSYGDADDAIQVSYGESDIPESPPEEDG